ncbi:Gfo/Idh/MocA family protein [Aquabacter spiritensis]|uniref:Putative dehydrogenase n=1 Tax=Aquabacter spiritensis TaxID=933073 RepID=A0A4R3LX26_9HYPH|nr:Gfo/Idh/MocA family oxidoreductase [Aquabacter spiritensis]TCT04726.1 putative dehydrogenase [Aquabacter spiritensis]
MHRIAIVGLGMAHAPHLASLRDLADRVDIAACYAPSAGRRAAFAAANPDLPVTGDLDAILSDPTIGLMLLLTPPRTHLDLVERCAAAGKHVLLEKPVEVDLARSVRAVAAMEAADRRFAIMLQHRFRPTSLKVAQMLETGAFGALISASASIRWWRPPDYYAQPGRGTRARDGGGVLLTQAIHTLDLFLSLTGPVARVAAITGTSPLRAIDTEDIAAAAVQFANGAIGTIDATTVAYPGFPERIDLACETATVVIAADALDIYWKDGRHIHVDGAQGGGGGADPMAFSHAAHRALIADFLDAVETGRAPQASGRSALAVQALIDAILASSVEGRPIALAPG